MIIRSLKLKNIRSYKEAEIEFPAGTILFEGDIGSGKSTILHAIEFALFGFSDINSEFLVRRGERKAYVELVMDIDGKEYTFYREIQGGSIKKCWIKLNNIVRFFSSEEMKAEVLKILRFRDRASGKARVLTYRYAFFTPQEEMKAILGASRDERLETLRKAFGVEEYRIARDNAREFRRSLMPEIERLSGQIMDLEEKENKYREVLSERKEMEEELKQIQKEKEEAENELKEVKKEKEKMDGLRERRIKLEKDRIEKEGSIRSLKERITLFMDAIKQAEESEKMMKEIEPVLDRYRELKDVLQDMEKKRERYNEISKEIGKRKAALNQIKKQIEENQKVIEKLPGLLKEMEEISGNISRIEEVRESVRSIMEAAAGLEADIKGADADIKDLRKEMIELSDLSGRMECPKCHQKLTEEHINKMIEEIEEKIREKESILQELDNKRLECKRLLKEKEKELSDLEIMRKSFLQMEARIDEIKRMDRREALIEEKNRIEAEVLEMEKDAGRYSVEEDEVSRIKNEMEALEPKIAEYHSHRKIAEQKDVAMKRLEMARKNLESAEDETGRLLKEISELEKEYSEERYSRVYSGYMERSTKYSAILERIEGKGREFEKLKREEYDLTKELEEKYRAREKMGSIQEFSKWLDEVLCPALESVESHMLASINQDFSEQFRRFFSIMLETSDIDVGIDPDFTPVVRQDGYEQDYGNLSGGEKTSVALAYRLALNTMVKKVSLAGSANLLILDEPTDGFSKEQIYKMRDVFEGANCDQIIVVSHEKELEGLVDRIYEVRKEGGVSRIAGARIRQLSLL